MNKNSVPLRWRAGAQSQRFLDELPDNHFNHYKLEFDMKRIITLCSLCAIMLLTPDKAEAQFLKKLGKAVNEVSNAIGKNDKKSSRKQKESTSRRSDSGSADSDMNSSETGNQSYGDEYVYVSIYEGKLKKGILSTSQARYMCQQSASSPINRECFTAPSGSVRSITIW